jgi:hypothetical protein
MRNSLFGYADFGIDPASIRYRWSCILITPARQATPGQTSARRRQNHNTVTHPAFLAMTRTGLL